MWIARISRNRNREDNVTKDELRTNDISELLEMLGRMLYDEAEILEMHIYKGGENGN